MKPILIGMNNPLSMESRYALYPLPRGSAGGRLYAMLRAEVHVTPREYVEGFERVNLVVGEWDIGAARARTRDLLPRLSGRPAVLLGGEVRRAFGMSVNDPCVPYFAAADFEFYQVPHPSGRNPWYNNPANRQRVGRLLADLYALHTETLT